MYKDLTDSDYWVTPGEAYGNLPVLSEPGYTFKGWINPNISLTVISNETIVTPTTFHFLTAEWSVNRYRITFDKQDGTGGTDSVLTYYGYAMSSASKPSRSDYIFAGYFTEKYGEGTKYYNADMSSAKDWDKTSDTTLYAHWTGPGGGFIFYDDNVGFDFDRDGTIQSTEKNLMPNARYLEAAPYGWNDGGDDPESTWGELDGGDNNAPITNLAVGSGKINTENIITYHNAKNPTENTPAKVCASYTGGGYSDWYLPSRDELAVMRKNLMGHDPILGGFSPGVYWSSSLSSNGYNVWFDYYNFGSPSNINEYRPIRAY